MKVQLSKFVRQTVELDITPLPAGVSYWHLRKYCSPHNEQWIRVIHHNNRRYKLVVVQLQYGELSMKSHTMYYGLDCSFMDANLSFVEKEFSYLNEGLSDVLFGGKGEHSTGCVEVKMSNVDEFEKTITTGLQYQLDQMNL